LSIIKRKKIKRLKNIHPGEVLQEEFLITPGISAYRLSENTGIPQTRISAIVKENRCITTDITLLFSKYFGNPAKCWLGLQDDFDIEEENQILKSTLASIPKFSMTAV